MTGKTKKTFLFSILGLIAIGGAIGYYLYNKPPRDAENADAIKVVSTELYQIFAKDSAAANKKYFDKVLEVSGVVNQVSQNQQKELIILLATNEPGAAVNCTMKGPAGNIKEKDSIIIKGICTGINGGDSGMGILGDVYMIGCYLKK